MILLPNKDYSQRFLDELNYIGYNFIEAATEFLVGETDEKNLARELERFFPAYLVGQNARRCYEILENMYEWLNDDYYHQSTRLNEYVLSRAIHNEWMYFNDLPEEESNELRNAYYSLSGNVELSEKELMIVKSMKDSELCTMDVFFDNFNFGELELLNAFFQKETITFCDFKFTVYQNTMYFL